MGGMGWMASAVIRASGVCSRREKEEAQMARRRAARGGRDGREATYVYWYLTHTVVQQKLTKHCKAIIPQLKKKSVYTDRKFLLNHLQIC